MKPKLILTIVALIIIVPLAIGAAVMLFMTNRVVEGEKQNTKLLQQIETENNQKSKVVFAVKNIKEGTVMSADDLDERELQITKIPESSISNMSAAVGFPASVDIASGTIILQGHVKTPKTGAP